MIQQLPGFLLRDEYIFLFHLDKVSIPKNYRNILLKIEDAKHKSKNLMMNPTKNRGYTLNFSF